MRKWIVVVAVRASVVCLGLLISSGAARAERLPIRTYTVADGLPHNSINRIVRDSRGFLWFCTAEGLALFDGYRFLTYGTADGLPHPTVTDLLETRAGEYWVATDAGVARFSPRGRPIFTVFVPPATDRRGRAVTRLLEGRDGTIWGGTRDGLIRVSRGRDEVVRVDLTLAAGGPSAIEALLEDRHGTLWIGAANGLFRRWSDGRIVRYDKRDGLPDDYVHDLLEDRQGRLWVGSRAGGFFSLITDSTETTPVVLRSYRRANGFVDFVFDLCETSDGRLVVGTNVGLFEFRSGDDARADPPQHYTKRNGFSYHEIANVAEDRDGNVWLGTVNGASKIARGGFRTFGEQDGVDLVNSLFASADGEIYAFGYVQGSRGSIGDRVPAGVETYWSGIGHFDAGRFTWLMPDLGGAHPSWSPQPFVTQARTGEWWIGTTAGLYLFPRVTRFADLAAARPAAVYTTQHGLATQTVYSIYEDSRGDVWISTIASPTGLNGLARWERATRSVRDLAGTPGLPALTDRLPISFRDDRQGGVWVGFSPDGLARYASGRFHVFTTHDGLPAGAVDDLHLDSAGRLWIATSRGGIARIDEPAASRPALVTYSTAQGLSSDRVTTIVEDLQGRIYAGTGRGLDQITPATGRIRHFTTADGLVPGEIAAAVRDRSGALWFGTNQGLSGVTPESDPAPQAPPIWINGLRSGGEHRDVSALGEMAVALPDLRADRNQLQIDFVGLSFAPGESLRYQYTLDGGNGSWSTPTEQRTVHLAGLAPGAYTFRVRAINVDHVASSAPATVRFTVLAPFWRQSWFVALTVFAAGACAYSLYRYRLFRLLELERVRTRIASDLHDDIGAGLSRIAVLSEVGLQNANRDDARAASPIASIAGAARELLDAMSDIVWAINPERDHVRDLSQRMRRFASDMFTAGQIAFSFRAPGDDRRLRVATDVRRHVFLIFKEAVNNVLRHSGCTSADLELRADGGLLVLTVSDNGRGFDPARATEGNGLDSMRDRASLMGGELRIESHHGQGTVVRLTVPRKAVVKEHNRRLRRRAPEAAPPRS